MTAQEQIASDSIAITPMSVHTGAEISGVDLHHPLTEVQIHKIRNALLKWRVVFFRGQALTHPEHIALAKQFGEPTPGPVSYTHLTLPTKA